MANENAPEFNAELAEVVLGVIRANPEGWNQGEWCGTARCFAGHAVVLSGWDAYQVGFEARAARALPDGTREELPLPVVARNELGLTSAQGDVLFAPENTLGDLERFVKDLANGEPIQGDGFDWLEWEFKEWDAGRKAFGLRDGESR